MDRVIEAYRPSGHVDRWSDGEGFRALRAKSKIASILVMKVDHIGDFILSFEALIALRNAFPDARMELLCAPWNKAIALSLGLFDAVHTVAFFSPRADGEHPSDRRALIKYLPEGRYDLAIDLRVDSDSRMLLRHIKATYRVGFESHADNDILTACIPHRVPGMWNQNIGIHQSMLMLRLARSAVDIFNRTDDVKQLLLGRLAEPSAIDLSIAQGRILVVCNTSSGRVVKNWAADRFRRLVRWLAVEMDAVVLLIGGKDQLEESEAIIRFCGSPNVISAVGRTSIGQAVNLLAQASVFVGNDSGLTHVAARLDIPTVVLMSGVDPTVMWAPLGDHVTILRAPVPCSPCHIALMSECHGGHSCMVNLTEPSVRAAVRTALLKAARYGDPVGHRPPDLRQDASFRGWSSSRSEQVPQRYSDNHHRYLAGGGQLRIEQLLQGFVHNSPNNRGDLNRFYTLALIFDQILKEQISGDIAELGVYKGNTAFMLACLARQLGTTAYLLDTFEGFSAEDLSGVDADKALEFADTSLEQVRALVGQSNVTFVRGFFPDTSDQIPAEARFSLVHIDCDLYQPFKAALHFFYDRLVPGGFLVMHDYSSLHWDGAERAVDEFFADKPESISPVPDSAGTVVVRKAKGADRFKNWFVQRTSSGFANSWVYANSTDVKVHLADGWSQPEVWGTWGIGESHTLALVLTQMPDKGIEFAAETSAVLFAGRRDSLSVDVLVDGERVACWRYDLDHNTAIRTAIIPQARVTLRDGLPFLNVEFRPSACEPPRDLDPKLPDDRRLGIGLVRFRQRQL